MLINAQFPIDIAVLEHQDQTLSLAGMTWEDYEKFNVLEYPGYRTSFFKGIITLVSPSKNHERIAQTIAILVSAYCRRFKIDYFPMGSTRLKKKPLAGKEPDVSFAFNTDKDFPDLAVEVIFSSGSFDDLQKYQALGIKEVWFWQDNKITFYQLQEDKYVEIFFSNLLPQLNSQTLATFVNRGSSESSLVIESDFVDSFK